MISTLGRICSEEQINWVNVELVRNALCDLDRGVFNLREAVKYIKEVGAEDPEETSEFVSAAVGYPCGGG